MSKISVLTPDGEEDFYPYFYPDNYALTEDDKLSPWSEQEGAFLLGCEVVINWCVPMHAVLKTCQLYLLHLVSWKLRCINFDDVINVYSYF
jgi:hypothetical protein